MSKKITKKRTRRCISILLAVIPVLICFLHAIEVYGADGSAQVTFTVNQVYNTHGITTVPERTYTYYLVPISNSEPMPSGSGPEGYIFHVSGTHSIKIGPINFTEPGTYVYILSCADDAHNIHAFSDNSYRIEVYVLSDLSTYSVVYIHDKVKAMDISFEHEYEPGSEGHIPPNDSNGHDKNLTSIKTNTGGSYGNNSADAGGKGYGEYAGKGPKTGDDINLVLYIILLILAAVIALISIFYPFAKKKRKKREEIQEQDEESMKI